MKVSLLALLLLFLAGCSGVNSNNQPEGKRHVDPVEYEDRLKGMWLGSTIANWTGLRTEGVRNEPPFYTDDDWGKVRPVRWSDEELPIEFVFQDPWLADDDTDIEYVYLHLMDLHGNPLLSADQISAGWQKHINHHIWVSNAAARELMNSGAKPPVTSMLPVNANSLAIDAQLTTEIFGAMAPGDPARALQLANLPIQTTASGYSAHAAQFFVILYSLASQADQNQNPEEQILWMVGQARGYLPDESKTAGIIDFVVADYLNNPDPNDWEQTRDRLYENYQQNAAENGFVYRDWTESSVNFGTALIALLYGQGDFKRTVQIGTLSGWDSDNGTSTMAGLIGLMIGYEALVAQFPEQEISDRYHIYRSRDNLPDYLPEDDVAEDTFSMMATRMMPLVMQNVIAAGGTVSEDGSILLDVPDASLEQNPAINLTMRSQNNAIQLSGERMSATVNGQSAEQLIDGSEFDFSGEERFVLPEPFILQPTSPLVTIEVTYNRPVTISSIILVEGDSSGFKHIEFEFLIEGEWVPAEIDPDRSDSPSPNRYEMLEFVLMEAKTISAVRLLGELESQNEDLHLLELDTFAPEN